MIFSYFGKNISPEEARRINPLSLAYIGDAVFEVIVREYLITNNPILSAHKLHMKAVNFVRAGAQSSFIRGLEGILTEEEVLIFKKGRNAKSPTMPKNASVVDYRLATGFEALIGYLYITGRSDRLHEILAGIFNEKSIEQRSINDENN